MKTSIIISICLAILQLGIAQNEGPSTESVTTPIQPSTISPESPATEPTTTPQSSTTSESPSTTPPQQVLTEASTISSSVESTTSVSSNKTNVKIVDKISEQIRAILKHFREPIPTGFPGQVVLQDPMPAPNATTDMTLGTGHFYNMTVHGLSNFTVEAVNLLLDEMQVYVMIHMKKIQVRGNFTIETYFTKSTGPFNMTLTNVTAEGTVSLKVDATGKISTDKASSDMQYDELSVGSGAGSLVQAALNGAGIAVLSSIKPHILKQIDQRLKDEVDKQLETSPKIPKIATQSPVNLAILEGRRFVREKYEPFTIQKVLEHDSDFLKVNIGPLTIHGLSKFARVGNLTVQMKEGIIQLKVRFMTGRLRGKCKFFYDFGKTDEIKKNGEAKFAINHLQFEATLNQSINLRNKPILDDLQLEVGKVQVEMDGNGDFDFLVDYAMRYTPELIRHLVVDALEEPIKEAIQSEVLNKINIEQLIEDNLPLMESYFIY
ncbi:uncharacterized protein LOC135841954 [Planococcus citri]|uniref:uncharacterized protein LOC135841954 n=1 Tax=Planococcus citri TaxID=170843 RepID=UPI0031F8A195